ncbi:hypothetical protein WMY93_012043 [Mugilogobius chulae]|uniref:Uncharacterized protein n=1 Tax=Mugilogobius chulae TaxID=88201 RepID=A0AAW0PD82_9GOBI
MKTGLKLFLSLALTLALFSKSAAGLSCITCDPNDSSCTWQVLIPAKTEKPCVSLPLFSMDSNQWFIHSENKGMCCVHCLSNYREPGLFTRPPKPLLMALCSATAVTLHGSCRTHDTSSSSSTVPAHGCASGNLCLMAQYLSTSPLLTSIGSIQGTPTCCNIDHCNPLTTTTIPLPNYNYYSPTTTTTTTAPTTTTTTAAPTTTTTAPTTTTTTAATTTTTTTTKKDSSSEDSSSEESSSKEKCSETKRRKGFEAAARKRQEKFNKGRHSPKNHGDVRSGKGKKRRE